MKIVSFKSSLLLSAAALLAVSLSSCKKDQSNDITEEDAADAIATTMARPMGGSTEDFEEASRFARIKIFLPLKKWVECGQTKDTSFVKSATSPDGKYSYTHTRKWTVTLNCDDQQKPVSLVWTGTHNGSFDAPRMSGSGTGTRNWTLTGFGPDLSQPLLLNGTISRNGTRTSKVRNKLTFETSVNHTYTDVTIDKTSDRITGGSGTVTAVINVSNGTTKTYNGTVVFNGDGTATLTINGRVFTIQLY
jgi:hypothetical protein